MTDRSTRVALGVIALGFLLAMSGPAAASESGVPCPGTSVDGASAGLAKCVCDVIGKKGPPVVPGCLIGWGENNAAKDKKAKGCVMVATKQELETWLKTKRGMRPEDAAQAAKVANALQDQVTGCMVFVSDNLAPLLDAKYGMFYKKAIIQEEATHAMQGLPANKGRYFVQSASSQALANAEALVAHHYRDLMARTTAVQLLAGELEGGALSPDDAAKCKEALKAFLDGVEAVKTALCAASDALAKLAPADPWIATTENCKKVSDAFLAHARTLTN